MKTKIYIVIAAILAALFGSTVYLYKQNQKIKLERDNYKGNSESLLLGIKNYKTKDSLNAATVGMLILTVSDFERLRKKDSELIKSLQVKNRDLQSVSNTQTQTINKLKGKFRDSIIKIPDEIGFKTDTLRCIDIINPWYELHGCSNKNGDFTGTFKNIDSLLIAVTVDYKRFLGFLWKTKKVKNRKVDVISRNPSTEIKGIEFVQIEK